MPPTPDKLALHGRDQLELAADALEAIDADARDVGYIVRAIWALSKLPVTPQQPERFHFYDDGLHGMKFKADIIMGLELLSRQADTPEKMLAAQALLEIVREQ